MELFYMDRKDTPPAWLDVWFLCFPDMDGQCMEDKAEQMRREGWVTFPVCYGGTVPEFLDMPLAQVRSEATSHIFSIWAALSDCKPRAKSPYNCKEFMAFIRKKGFLDADLVCVRPLSEVQAHG